MQRRRQFLRILLAQCFQIDILIHQQLEPIEQL